MTGSEKIAKMLIEKGAKVDILSDNYDSPIILAADKGKNYSYTFDLE